MNERKEIIEMLYLLKEQARVVSSSDGEIARNTTLLANISPQSFDWVMTSAIAKLKEDGGMWE